MAIASPSRAAPCAETALAVLVLAAAVAPFWAGRFLPFLDLPQHLALSRVVARLGDPVLGFARYYAVDGRVTPYWGYYAAMRWLDPLAGPELANRLLVSAYAAGLPLAAAYALRGLGRDGRWAVFTVPLVFGTNLFFGFMGFVLSLPLFLVGVGLAARHLAPERADARRALRLAAVAVLVFLFHAQTWALLLVAAAVLLAIEWRGARWAAARSLPLVPSALLAAPWLVRSFVLPEASPLAPSHTVHHQNYGTLTRLGAHWEPLAEVLRRIPERLLGAFNDRSDVRLGAAMAAVLVLAAGASHLSAPAAAGEGPVASGARAPVRAFLRRHRGEALALVLLATYLAAPLEIAAQWYVGPRHLVLAALLAPAFVAAPAVSWRRWLLAPAAAVALAACANAAAHVAAFQRQVGPFAEILPRLEPGRRVMNLMFDSGARGPVRLWPFLHWSCYCQALRGGDVSFSFAGLPSIPVVYRPGMQAPHPYEWSPQDFDWATMGPAYDYFLVRGRPWGRAADLPRHARLIAEAGPWQLWGRE